MRDNAAALALARHAGAVLLESATDAVAAAGLADLVVAVRGRNRLWRSALRDFTIPRRGARRAAPRADPHRRPRHRRRAPAVVARLAGYDGVNVISAEDVPDAAAPAGGRLEQQLAQLAAGLAMAAVYLRLVRG